MAMRVPPGGSPLGSFLFTTSALALGGPRSQIVNGWAPDALSTAALDIDFTTGTLDPRITFARGSTATYYNSSGLIASTASGAPRFDYDPTTLTARGLLLEEQRTNVALSSEDATNGSVWSFGSTGATANVMTAPDGNVTADLYYEIANNDKHYQFNIGGYSSITPGVDYTFSKYAKYAGRYLEMTLVGTGGNDGCYAIFDLQAGTVTQSAAFPSGTLTAARITALPNGWYRCEVTGRTASATSVYNLTGLSNTGTSGSVGAFGDIIYLGDGTSGAYLWGTQFELGAFATSYIPTTTVAVTRSADTAEMTGANFSGWYNASAGTFVTEYRPQSVTGTQPVISVSDTTANESIRLYGSGADPKAIVVDGGTTQADLDAGTIAAANASFYKLGLAFAANDFAACFEGGTVATDAAGTLPTVTQLQFHTDIAGNVANLHIKRLQFFNTRKTDSELQALTAGPLVPATGTGALTAQSAVAASTTGASGSTSPGSTAPTTFNPSDKSANVTLSAGDLQVGASSTIAGAVRTVASLATGKSYFEIKWTVATGGAGGDGAGIATATANLSGTPSWPGNGTGGLIAYVGGSVNYNGAAAGIALGAFANNDVACFAIDLTNSRAWVRKNGGNWNNSGTANPATNVGGIDISSLFPTNAFFGAVAKNGAVPIAVGNFGATAFTQAVPSGFSAGPAVAPPMPVASPATVTGVGVSGSTITDTTLNATSATVSSTTGVSGATITDTTLDAGAAVLSSTTGLVRAIGNASALTAQAATVIGLGTGAGAAAIGAGALSSRPATLASTGLTQTIGSGALIDGSATLGALAVSGSTGIGELDATAADIDSLGYVEQGGVSIKIAGEWQRTTPYVCVGGAWKPATAWANVNGEWKRVA